MDLTDKYYFIGAEARYRDQWNDAQPDLNQTVVWLDRLLHDRRVRPVRCHRQPGDAA